MSIENTDNLFHALLEQTAADIKEDAVPAGQEGGPSITPDVSDLTPPSGRPADMRPSGGQPPYSNGGNHGGRPPHDGLGMPPMNGPLYVPYPYPYPPTVPYYGNNPIRSKRMSGKVRNPEDCETFEEQVSVIADNIRSLIISGRYTQAVRYIGEWYDGVTDDDERLFPETRAVLQDISKNNLVLFIEALIQFAGFDEE